jgi:3-hydroxy-9,10-secoandrosta-1,3,5(10)-triene-9,17-dione monooxygenase reductase component
MADFPTAVTVVAALGPEGPTGATANAVTSLSLDPPLMLACLDRGSRTLRVVEDARRFSINVLIAGQGELARRFSTKDPHPVKWDGVGWTERAGTPMVDGALLWIACDLRDLHDGGDHAIATGRILELVRSPGDPLVFHHGEYRGLKLG